MYTQIALLFALIFTGIGLCKIGVLNKAVNLGINRMTLYFAFPCMITYKIGTMEMDPSLGHDFLVMTLLSGASFVLFTVIAFCYYRARGMQERITRCAVLSTIMPNNGFIGYPVALAVYGQPGLLMMIVHGAIAFNVYVFTYGITYIRKEKDPERRFTRMEFAKLIAHLITNPVIISIPAGLLIMYLGIPMDNLFGKYLSAISEMASPLAMIYVGAAIGERGFLSSFKDRDLWEISFVKLIVMPLIMGLVFIWMPISPLLKATLVLGAAFPCATIPVMLGQQEGLDYSQAGRALLLSTILSVGTLPLVLKIISVLIPV